MKILVCISKTPDTTAKIGFVDGGVKYNEDGITFIMNPYDEWYALVRALEIKEKQGGTVTVLNVGDASNDIIIRKALAIGADDAIRVDATPKSAEYVARQIAHVAQQKGFDMIFMGKETIDYNGSEVGPMVAEVLDYDFFGFVSNLQIEGDQKMISREIEGGVEIISTTNPAVISAAKGLAEQRIPNMQGIMMSKRKPLEVVAPIEVGEKVKLVVHTMPEPKKGVKLIDADNMDELVRLLHEEAKAL
ncbi:MAG TPA: electron transfer flavoprotein subunit beta/FixA family protein [Saprospiraceae bacterium]|nr:electron transfer flavoprotein subunit beta/FixA family protein [Saprospiraceae bacterium]